MDSNNDTQCKVCNKDRSQHKDSEKFYCFLQDLATSSKVRKDSEDHWTFNNIENLVFQGGGVKGVAYLGVLKELLKRHGNLVKNVKRVAGTSAGSILALYLSLNIDYKTIHKYVVGTPLVNTLDDHLWIEVDTISEIPSNQVSEDDPRRHYQYSIKDILGKFLQQLAQLNSDYAGQVKQGSPIDQLTGKKKETAIKGLKDAAVTRMNEIIFNFMMYFNLLNYFKSLPGFLNWTNSLTDSIKKSVTLANLPGDDALAFLNKMGDSLNDIFPSTEENPQVEESSDSDPEGEVPSGPDRTKSQGQDAARKPSDQLKRTDGPPLEGKILDYALAKLLGATFFSTEADQYKTQVGFKDRVDQASLFVGRAVKQQLIYDPIVKQIRKVVKQYRTKEGKVVKFDPRNPPFDHTKGRRPRSNANLELVTFDDLERCLDENGEKCFKHLYITSFRVDTTQTEVYSYEHTPNATVADAVRASMSIPLFFSSVPLRINDSRRYFKYNDPGQNLDFEHAKGQQIPYMDGGVFDNFALWLFDDLKYCSPEKEWENLPLKVHIDNPRTLGFALYDSLVTTKVDENAQEEAIKKKIDSPIKLALQLLSTILGSFEENMYSRSDQSGRTIKVDNLGVSTVAFNMRPITMKRLKAKGKEAVRNYIGKQGNLRESQLKS